MRYCLFLGRKLKIYRYLKTLPFIINSLTGKVTIILDETFYYTSSQPQNYSAIILWLRAGVIKSFLCSEKMKIKEKEVAHQILNHATVKANISQVIFCKVLLYDTYSINGSIYKEQLTTFSAMKCERFS